MPFLLGQPQLLFFEALHAEPTSKKIINAKMMLWFSFFIG
jgi:hypothetical protein